VDARVDAGVDVGVDVGVAAADTGAAAVMEAVDVEARAVATVVVVKCAGDQIHRLRKRLSYADLREYWYWYVSKSARTWPIAQLLRGWPRSALQIGRSRV
jgi:hypothetical protein